MELKFKEKILFTQQYKEGLERIFYTLSNFDIFRNKGIETNTFLFNKMDEKIPNLFFFDWKANKKFNFEFFLGTDCDSDSYKCTSGKISKLNGEKINGFFQIKEEFYFDTCQNKTIFVYTLKYDSKGEKYLDKFLSLYDKEFQFTILNIFNSITFSNKSPQIGIDTILVYRPSNQVIDYLKDINNIFRNFYNNDDISSLYVENKDSNFPGIYYYTNIKDGKESGKYIIDKRLLLKNSMLISMVKSENNNEDLKRYIKLLVIEISPISSYVSIENVFDYSVDEDYVKDISRQQQHFLKNIKYIMQRQICYGN